MSIYDEMQSVAKDVFRDFNQGVIKYIAVTPAVGGTVDDPGAPQETAYTLEGATARGAQFKYVSSGLALATDTQVNMSVDNRFVPDGKGFVEVDGVRMKVMQVIRKPQAGTPVAYSLIARLGGK